MNINEFDDYPILKNLSVSAKQTFLDTAKALNVSMLELVPLAVSEYIIFTL
jgi:hypothetical protein